MNKTIILFTILAIVFAQDFTTTEVEEDLASKIMPNIGFLFRGYDIIKGNPLNTEGLPIDQGYREQIFKDDLGTDETPDHRYRIHKGVFVNDCRNTCSTSFSSKSIKTTYDYQQSLQIKASVSGGGWGASFSASTDYKKVERKTGADKSIFTQAEAQCCAYQARHLTFAPPKLHPNFAAGLKFLPEAYNQAKYRRFINAFGTHFVFAADMGARYGYQSEMSEKQWSTFLQTGFNLETSASYSGFGASVSASFSTNKQKQQADAFNSNTQSSKKYSVGVTIPRDGKTSSWVQNTIESPMPINIQLKRIDMILTNEEFGVTGVSSQKTANLKRALDEYCAELVSEKKIRTCKAPRPYDRNAPKLPSSCQFCHGQCGGKYSQNGGSIVMNQSWPNWERVFGQRCGGRINDRETRGGTHLCCENNAGQCRICGSCGGEFRNFGGKLMKDANWPNWIRAYDQRCRGHSAKRQRPSGGFSLCCSGKPLCSLCASCGGSWPHEQSAISTDQHWPNFFEIRGGRCAGNPRSQSYHDGVSLCCQNPGAQNEEYLLSYEEVMNQIGEFM